MIGLSLATVRPAPGANRKKKRVGRGPGSGHGKTSGRGHKGKGARAGGNTPPGYEGGQMPLQRRIPKRGFRPRVKKRVSLVNLHQLDRCYSDGEMVDAASLRARRLIRSEADAFKILGKGELTKALVVRTPSISSQAKARIEAAGGRVEVA